jgi:dipeptidyl aminopeptidase/acylaminoacyl peptidase
MCQLAVFLFIRTMEIMMTHVKTPARLALRSIAILGLFLTIGVPMSGQGQPQSSAQIQAQMERQVQAQAQTDAIWRAASEGVMTMDKITYKSRAGGLEIPAFLFQPLKPRGPKGHPALVWVHPDIRGHLYEYYIPYVREAVSRGYIVIAPEYRGSVGYGQAFYDAIDYGGAEVDDVISATDYLKSTVPAADPARIGIIGWSHGGMITLLSIARAPALFKAAAAIVPVTNLFQRLAYAGVESRKQAIDPANRYGGLPNQVPEVYKARSPLYQVDKLQIPVLVHVTKNDRDVHIEEDMQIVDALRSRKSDLAETKVYENPLGGHLFDRMCPATLPGNRGAAPANPQDLARYAPTNTREQVDSWNRVWTFLDWNLDPFKDAATALKNSGGS